MKKKKLLAALLVCAAVSLSANAAEYSGLTWEGNYRTSSQGGVGGVFVQGTGSTSTITFDGCTFNNNHAYWDGGAGANYKDAVIKNSTFTGNTAQLQPDNEGNFVLGVSDTTPLGGGAVALGSISTSIIENTIFTGNVSGTTGGAIGTRLGLNQNGTTNDNSAAKLDIIGSTFTNNHAYNQGGAIYNTFYHSVADADSANISGNTFTGNTAYQGGAIYNSELQDSYGNSGVLLALENTFTGNSANSGGAIFNASEMTVGGTFDSNKALHGGAIYNTGKLTIEDNSTFKNNFANIAGSAIANASGQELKIGNNVTFSNNSSFLDGYSYTGKGASEMGALYSEGNADRTNKITIGDNVTFEGNKAYGGAGLYLYGANDVTIGDGAKFLNNISQASATDTTLTSNGSAIKLASNGSNGNAKVSIGKNAEFSGNKAKYAGAVYVSNDGDTFTVGDNAKFTNNEVSAYGGAIVNSGKTTISLGSGAEFKYNKADSMGGAIVSGGELHIGDKATFSENIVQTSAGGAIAIVALDGKTAPVATIGNESVFDKNEAAFGGAIYNGGSIEIGENASFSDNHANIYGGGAIYNAGALTINDKVTFSNNTADLDGGGAILNTSNITIKNGSKFEGNSALIGGAIYNAAGAVVTMSGENTFSGNIANGEANDIYNKGTINITSGTTNLDGGIKGDGTLTIGSAEVVNNGTLEQKSVSIASGGSLTTALSKMNVTNGITDDGTLTLTGNGTIDKVISGTGDVNISGVVTSAVANTVSGNVNLASGSTLKLADVAGADLFSSAKAVNAANGSTINLQNGKSGVGTGDNVNMTNLVIADGDTVNLRIDWGDTFDADASKIGDEAEINVSSIDLTSTDGTLDTYTFTTNIKDVLTVKDSVELKTKTGSSNMVAYNVLNGELTSAYSTLAGAVVDASNGAAIYDMQKDEPAGIGSASGILSGKLIVQGNGNSITGTGITLKGNGTDNAELTLKDTSLSDINVTAANSGAIHVNGGDSLTIIAEKKDITMSGTSGSSKNAIYLEHDGTNAATAIITAKGGKIEINDDITSNNKKNRIKFSGSKAINFNGTFDPATADMSAASLTRGGKDIGIDWNLNGGTLSYLQDSYLSSDGSNSINFNGGNLNLVNGAANTINLAGITLSKDSNIFLDVDLKNQTMDNFGASPATYKAGTLHVANLNLLSDSESLSDNTSINFTSDSNLMGHVDYTGSGLAISPIYNYGVSYDGSTGNFNFARSSLNPSILAAPVAAQLGGYLTQLNAYDEAFRNMDMYMLMPRKEREAMKLRNKYAAADSNLVFDPTNTAYENAGAWFRPYATFENVHLKHGPRVSNVAYGSFFGVESELVDLGRGWDGMYGVYAGYNGSHQAYDGVGIFQNGGTLGFTGMAYKGNFFTGLTLNAGANVGEASTMYGSENFTMLMAGIASKTGYNWELADGKFIIQPSFLMSYSFVDTFDYTNAAGIRIKSDPLNAIQIEPGLKFIGNMKNGWQPYAGVSVVWNVMDKTDFHANNVGLPELSVKPFVRYGLGVRKIWGERCTGFLQTFFTNGGRNGVGFQAGFRWELGRKDVSSSVKTGNVTPELPKTQIKLSNAR